MTSMRGATVPLGLIDVPEAQGLRTDAGAGELETLIESMRTIGLLQPIVVKAVGARVELLAGHRRLQAARNLGWSEIRCSVMEGDSKSHRAATVLENIARRQLTPIEEAAALPSLCEGEELSVAEIQRLTGRSRGWVESRLSLLDYPPQLQQAVHEAKISLAAAECLAQVPDPERREYLVAQASANGINASTAAYWLQQELSAAPAQNLNVGEGQTAYPIVNSYETRALCWVCGESKSMAETQRVSVCPGCIGRVVSARGSAAGSELPASEAPAERGGVRYD